MIKRFALLFTLLFASIAFANHEDPVRFDYTIGGALPRSEVYTLFSLGDVPLPITATGDRPWISIFLTDSSTPAILSLNIKPAGLATGLHTGTMTVSVANEIFRVAISLQVRPGTVVPTPIVFPSQLSFRVRASPSGGYENTAPEQSVTINSTQPGPLSVSLRSSVPWLVARFQSGSEATTPVEAKVSLSATAMPPGTYSGSFIVGPPAAAPTSFTAVTIPVTLIVEAASPLLTLSTNVVSFAAIAGAADPAEQKVTVGSSGATIPFSVSNPAPWLSTELNGNTPATLTLRVRTAGLPMGESKVTVRVTSGSQTLPFDVVVRVTPNNRPVITSMLSANSVATVSAGSWASIYGRNLAPRTKVVAASDLQGGVLPKSLDGVTVRIGGQLSPVHYVSPTQLNVLVPVGLTGYAGTTTLEVITAEGSATGVADVREVSPGAFDVPSANKRLPAAVFPDGTTLLNRAAKPGDILMIFGTGFGPTSPLQLDGAIAPGLNTLAQAVEVTLGDMPAKVLYGGLVGPGLYQFNVEIPILPAGDHQLLFRVNSSVSPAGVVIPVSQ